MLPFAGHSRRGSQVHHRIALASQVHPLKPTRQHAGRPLTRGNRLVLAAAPKRGQHHETRQILRLRTQPIGHPRTHARATRDLRARVHEHVGRIVIDGLARHGTHPANLIGHRAQLGEEFTQFDTGFPETLEGQLRSVANQLLSLELGDLLTLGERLGHRLAVHLRQLGLGIEGFQMRRTTGHTQPDHPPCLRWKVQWSHRATHCSGRAGRLKDPRLENRTQRQGTQALRRATQKQTSGLLLLKKLTDLRGWAHGQERVMVS